MAVPTHIKIDRLVVTPISQKEMYFQDVHGKPECRAIHVATIRATARGKTRMYVNFYREDDIGYRYLEERVISNVSGYSIVQYLDIKDPIEFRGLQEFLQDHLWQMYEKGQTIAVFGVECKDPIPTFLDIKTGKLDISKEKTTSDILDGKG